MNIGMAHWESDLAKLSQSSSFRWEESSLICIVPPMCGCSSSIVAVAPVLWLEAPVYVGGAPPG